MNPDLEKRLRACYPHGQFDLLDEAKLDTKPAADFWARVPAILSKHGFYCEKPYRWSGHEHVVEFTISRVGDPKYWYFIEQKTEKTEALRDSGKPFVQLQARVSTIIPALFISIQETRFDPDTYGSNAKGEYDDGLKTTHHLRDTPHEPWAALLADLRALGKELGLADLDDATLREDAPFVTSPIFNDDDEDIPNFDNEAEEIAYYKTLPQYVCCVYDCLFGAFV